MHWIDDIFGKEESHQKNEIKNLCENIQKIISVSQRDIPNIPQIEALLELISKWS